MAYSLCDARRAIVGLSYCSANSRRGSKQLVMRKPDERITKKEFNSIAAQGQDLEDDEDADG